MMHRRRGVFLVEMLTVLFMVGIGGTLMAVGLASLLRSQDRVSVFGNQFTHINDFLRCIKRDVRSATSATLLRGDASEPQAILFLNEPPTQVSYRFFENHVERSGGDEGDTAKLWSSLNAQVSIPGSPEGTENTGVAVTVFWRRASAKEPDPDRRLDLFARCSGGVENEAH
jgi:type II secretory pathway pseudopilin PulG